MKIYCSRTDLNKAIHTVGHAVPSRTPSKILEGVLVECLDHELQLTATDMNMTLSTRIAAECEQQAPFVVQASLFSNIVSKLPEDDVQMDYDEEKKLLRIVSGVSHTELVCFTADEFPRIITKEGQKLKLAKRDVRQLVKKTAFSASNEEINGILTGVLVEITSAHLRMVAVDTYRMAICEAETENGEETSVVIPARMLAGMAKIMDSDEENAEPMTLEIDDTRAIFSFDQVRAICNTCTGKYIDYQRLIKGDSTIKIRVLREPLLESIERAAIITNIQNNNLVKFNISDNILQITSLSDQANIEEKVEVIKEGEDIVIGFNARYLLEALKVIEDEEIMLSMKNSVSPCIITPLKGEKYLYLILPVRIG